MLFTGSIGIRRFIFMVIFKRDPEEQKAAAINKQSLINWARAIPDGPI